MTFVDDHVSVDAPTYATVVGDMEKVSVGAGIVTVTDCATVRPVPVQVSV